MLTRLIRGYRAPAIGVLVLSLLSACAGDSLAVNRYMLPRADGAIPACASSKPYLQVMPPRLSGLVDRNGLVMQTSEIQLHEANAHQWAEDLAAQLQRAMQRSLSQHSENWCVVANSRPSATQLKIQVQQFQGRFDGQAIVSGQWQIIGADGNLQGGQNFWLSEALQAEGYKALVYSLSSAWQRLAVQVAQHLDAAEQQSSALVE